MPSILPPDTDLQDEDALSALHEFDIPCGYHEHAAHSSASASWAIWYRRPRVCGCANLSDFNYLCQPCWAYVNSKGGRARCPQCLLVVFISQNVLRLEHL